MCLYLQPPLHTFKTLGNTGPMTQHDTPKDTNHKKKMMYIKLKSFTNVGYTMFYKVTPAPTDVRIGPLTEHTKEFKQIKLN